MNCAIICYFRVFPLHSLTTIKNHLRLVLHLTFCALFFLSLVLRSVILLLTFPITTYSPTPMLTHLRFIKYQGHGLIMRVVFHHGVGSQVFTDSPFVTGSDPRAIMYQNEEAVGKLLFAPLSRAS